MAGSDSTYIGFFKSKLKEWSSRAPWAAGGEAADEGQPGDRQKGDEASTSAAAVQSSVVQCNKEDLETHHGLVLQRFDSADWAMMQTKLKKSGGDEKPGGNRESPLSRLSEGTGEPVRRRAQVEAGREDSAVRGPFQGVAAAAEPAAEMRRAGSCRGRGCARLPTEGRAVRRPPAAHACVCV